MPIRRIAAEMNWSPSTVSRELRRNAGQRGCRRKQAEGEARERLKAKPKCVRMTPEVVAFAEPAWRTAGVPSGSAGA